MTALESRLRQVYSSHFAHEIWFIIHRLFVIHNGQKAKAETGTMVQCLMLSEGADSPGPADGSVLLNLTTSVVEKETETGERDEDR